MKKHLIIYAPNGREWQYSTVDLGSVDIILAESITFATDHTSVTVRTMDDNKKQVETFVGFPFRVESWD